MGKRSLELKKDLDAALCQENACTAGSSLTPALMGGLEVWLGYYSNTQSTVHTAHGTAIGADDATTPGVLLSTGLPNRALTDEGSTIGTLTEAIFKRVLARAVTDGAHITTLLTTPAVKAAIAKNFAGIATRYREVPRGQAAIVSGADLYVSDFGEITLRYSRQIRTVPAVADGGNGTVIFGLDPDMLAVAYLQPFNEFPLAKTGHADTRVLAVEATLVVKNDRGLFKILVADAAGFVVA
jgi:hypothetical protein